MAALVFYNRHDRSKEIVVQQDNACPHTLSNNKEMIDAGRIAGFNIRMLQQPENSPELNVLDLGLFNTIDKLQHKHPRQTVDELIASVKWAFDALSSAVINRAFVSLQGVMEQIILNNGDNNFSVQHMNKRKTEKKLGELPLKHCFFDKAYRKVQRLLQKQQRIRHIEMWGCDDSDIDNDSTVCSVVQVVSSTDEVATKIVPSPLTQTIQQRNSNDDVQLVTPTVSPELLQSNRVNAVSNDVVLVTHQFLL